MWEQGTRSENSYSQKSVTAGCGSGQIVDSFGLIGDLTDSHYYSHEKLAVCFRFMLVRPVGREVPYRGLCAGSGWHPFRLSAEWSRHACRPSPAPLPYCSLNRNKCKSSYAVWRFYVIGLMSFKHIPYSHSWLLADTFIQDKMLKIPLNGLKKVFPPSHLGLRLLVVLSLISCSSKKEMLGSKMPISFITSCVFKPEEAGLSSEDSSGLPMSSRTSSCTPHLNAHTNTLWNNNSFITF